MSRTVDDKDVVAEIRQNIQAVGGLVSLMDLAREWGISRTRIHQIAHYPDFPAPVGEVATDSQLPTKLYARSQCNDWRSITRKPGPKPKPKRQVDGDGS